MAYTDTKVDGVDKFPASEYNNFISHVHRNVVYSGRGYTAAENDVVLVADGETVTLPSVHFNGDMITVKNIDTDVVTITSTDNIDSSSNDISLNYQWESITIVSDGEDWFII